MNKNIKEQVLYEANFVEYFDTATNLTPKWRKNYFQQSHIHRDQSVILITSLDKALSPLSPASIRSKKHQPFAEIFNKW